MSDEVKLQQAALAPVAVEAEPFKPLAQGWDGQLRFEWDQASERESRRACEFFEPRPSGSGDSQGVTTAP